MKILVTNDDGFYSPGLATLAEAASRFGDVLVMAPDEDQSATSMAITIRRPLTYQPIKIGDFEAYRSPARASNESALDMGCFHELSKAERNRQIPITRNTAL